MRRIAMLLIMVIELASCGVEPDTLNTQYVMDAELRVVCYDFGYVNSHSVSCTQLDVAGFQKFVEKYGSGKP